MVLFRTCFVIFTILSSLIIADDPCRYESPLYGVIDITSLSDPSGRAAYADRTAPPPDDYKYSYNPCKPFSEGNTCTNVAACQVSKDGQNTYVIANQDSANWDPGFGPGSDAKITYNYIDKRAILVLKCTPDSPDNFQVINESPINTYNFQLSSKCACWNGCTGPAPTTAGPGPTSTRPGEGGSKMQPGIIFVALIVGLLVAYFIVFAVYNGVRHQRRGVDLIAHRTFWAGVPVYAKDGVVFLARKATGKGGAYNSV